MKHNQINLQAACKTTAMGIMPHTEVTRALELTMSLDIPFWPQLPHTSFYEDMYAQSSENFPGITIDPGEEKDTIKLINLTSQDKVAMVGLFKPLVSRIKQTGVDLSIIEKDTSRSNIFDQKNRFKILKECTVAVITATSLLNNTMEEVLNELENPRHVVILGPSTPLCIEVFQGTPVCHLGGAIVLDTAKAMQINP